MIPEYSQQDLARLNEEAVITREENLTRVQKPGAGDWQPGRLDAYEKAGMAKNWVADVVDIPHPAAPDLGDKAALAAFVQANRAGMGSPNYNLCTQELYTGYEALELEGRTLPLWRYYKRKSDSPKRPCVVYFHGGGFMGGTVFAVENFCRLLAERADAVVFNVDYALSPEHPFPQGLDDCFAAVAHIAQNAKGYGIDPQRIALAGDSAGGNLAAAVSLRARDLGGPAIALQVPIYPVLFIGRKPPQGYAWAQDMFVVEPNSQDAQMVAFVLNLGKPAPDGESGLFEQLYAPNPADAENPYASPMQAAGHSGLPPALIAVAEYDALRPQGEFYARQLAEAGVPVRLVNYRGATHAFVDRVGLAPQAEDLVGEIAAAVCAL